MSQSMGAMLPGRQAGEEGCMGGQSPAAGGDGRARQCGTAGHQGIQSRGQGARLSAGPDVVGPNGVELTLEESFDSDSPEFSYAIEPANVGVSLSADNEIVVASTATNGTLFNLIVTYTDPVTGFAVTAPLEFEVGFED